MIGEAGGTNIENWRVLQYLLDPSGKNSRLVLQSLCTYMYELNRIKTKNRFPYKILITAFLL